MLFDYRCRQFGAKAIHEGTTGSFEKFRITWQRLPLISRSLSLSLSLTPNYILYQKPIVCCCWLNQRPPIVTMPASCSSTIKMSVFNLCCTLYSTHSLTLSINSLSLPPFLAVLRILMSCLCFVSVSVRLNNRLEFRLPLGEWVLNERFNADNTIFTYDKNQSILRLVARPWKSITLTFRKWLIGENLYSIPSFYGLFTCV